MEVALSCINIKRWISTLSFLCKLVGILGIFLPLILCSVFFSKDLCSALLVLSEELIELGSQGPDGFGVMSMSVCSSEVIPCLVLFLPQFIDGYTGFPCVASRALGKDTILFCEIGVYSPVQGNALFVGGGCRQDSRHCDCG